MANAEQLRRQGEIRRHTNLFHMQHNNRRKRNAHRKIPEMASRAFTERNNAKNRLARTERIRKMSKALSSHSQMQRLLYRKTIKGQNLNRNQERGGRRTGKRTLTNMPTPDHKKTRAPHTQAVAKKRFP